MFNKFTNAYVKISTLRYYYIYIDSRSARLHAAHFHLDNMQVFYITYYLFEMVNFNEI